MKENSFGILVLGIIIGYSISQFNLTQNAKFAQEEAKNGRIISNDGWWLLTQESKIAFKPATPQYLERDFEAGANYICDQLLFKTGKDLCHTIIDWR